MAMAWKHFGSWHNALSAAGFPSKPRRKWSQDRLIEALRAIAPYNYSFTQIRQMDPSLGYAARMQFGGWHAALKAAGLPQIDHWNRQRVIDALQDRCRRGLPMTRMRHEDGALYSAAIRHFGSWSKALREVGIVLLAPRKWSKELVIQELCDQYRCKGDINRVRCENDALRGAACKYFGGWRQAVLAAGLLHPPRREWSQKHVIEAIQRWQQVGRNLAQVWKEDPSLYHAAKRFFGAWSAALRAANFRPNRHHWTAKSVLGTIRTQIATGKTTATIWRDSTLSSAAGLYFGSRCAALSAAGFPAQPPRRWTKKMVLDAIQTRHRKGLTLVCVGRQDRALAVAAIRRFGSWRKAMDAAGLKVVHKRWTKDQIIRELRVRHWTQTAGRDKVLESAAWRIFGSVRAAYVAAGIDPDAQRWSKQRVIEAIQDCHVRGLSLKASTNSNVACAGRRLFGSWYNAIIAAGIPAEARKGIRRRWTRETIINEIRVWQKERSETITRLPADNRLVSSSRKYFGSWRQALMAAGFHVKTCRHWSREKIVTAIIFHHKQGTLPQIWQIDRQLCQAGCKHFGSWPKALKAAGLEPNRQRWSKDRILKQLHALHGRGQHNVSVTDQRLYHAIRKYFGSRRAAYDAAGLQPTRCRSRKGVSHVA
jgi:hypothetical protein